MKRNKTRRLGKRDVLYWFAMTYSWVTTGVALSTFMPVSLTGIEGFAVAFAISTFVQVIIGVAWPEVSKLLRQGHVFTATIMLVFALGGSGTSGVLASSTNASIWNALAIRNVLEDKVVTAALAPVAEVARSAENTVHLLDDYAAFARSKSQREARSGDSCDGMKTGNSCGPICELRENQSRDASERRERTLQLLEKIDALRSSVRIGGIDDAKVADIFRAASSLSRDSLFAETERWARIERSAFMGEGFEVNGRMLICPDKEAIARLDEILATLPEPNADLGIPPMLPEQSISYVASENLSAIKVAAVAIAVEQRSPFTVLSEKPASTYAPFWLFSLLIELMCITLGIRLAKDRLLPMSVASDIHPPNPEQQRRAEIIDEVLGTLIIHNGRHTYLVVPRDGNGNRLCRNARVISRSASRLKLADFPVRESIPLVDLLPSEANRIYDATGASHVEVFKVRNLRKLERELVGILGFDDSRPANVVSLSARA